MGSLTESRVAKDDTPGMAMVKTTNAGHLEGRMKAYPQTAEEYRVEIGNKVYAAAVRLFERAEYEGIIIANGHHCAQSVCTFAMDLFVERMAVKEEPKPEPRPVKAFLEELRKEKVDAEG
jgi:hypothetical protein